MSKKKNTTKNQNGQSDHESNYFDARENIVDVKVLNKVNFLNENQKKLYSNIDSKDIVFAIGPAGTAKTFISVFSALKLFLRKNNKKNYNYDKIILIRPAVEAEENLGYLPGDINEKIDPFLNVYYMIIDEILQNGNGYYTSPKPSQSLIDHDLANYETFSYLRGKTFKNSLILVDEAQNITDSQMKLLVTRVGINSKLILTGDTKQSDIGKNVALEHWAKKLNNLSEVGLVEFSDEDIVRNPLITKVLKTMENKSE